MNTRKSTGLSMGLLSFAIMSSLSFAATNPDDPASASAADAAASSSAAAAADSSGSSSGGSGVNTQISGFIRSETAINTTGQTDPFNQNGNVFNGQPITRVSPAITDVATRNGQQDSQNINMQLFRAEVNSTTHLNDDLSFIMHARAIFDPGWYNEYDPATVGNERVGYTYSDPNYFKYHTPGNARPNPVEWAGSNYMIDFPALFLEYNHGPLDIRLGNQQIAWGQALFFRVLDVPDGLDFRRHSILDYAPEEFSDKRVPALGIRASYQASENWLIDGYVQKFQPTVYGNTNTPYNIIPSQFTVRDDYANYDNKLDEGFRIKGTLGDFGVQGIFVHRYNPDGVFAWTQSGVNRDIPGIPGSGQALACTPFEVSPGGVWSSNEWFYYAAQARLDGVGGLNSAINNFQPCTGALGAQAVPNYAYASQELNQFFQLGGGLGAGKTGLGGLVGWLSRKYYQENDIGGGLSYTLSGDPGSLTDQLILNWEVMYTPNRTFTAPDLNVNHITTDEWTTALTAEKYQRFSDSLPATYMVAEFMYKSKSDLFGRYLGGMGGSEYVTAPGQGGGGFKAVVIALQQPFPNLIWRADLSVLYDLQGGVLIQPGVRWKPNGKFTAEVFYNYINSHLGGNPNKNIFGGLDYAKELSVRVGYQF
jgi:hypothetical protein